MLAVAALDSGVTTREKTIWDPGYFQLKEGGRRYRNWKRTGHGWVDLMDSMAQSTDTYFYQVGVEMGIDTMHEYLSAFGFGEDATLDVSGALSGLLPSRDWKRAVHNEPWYPGDSVNLGIGQGYMLATPLQLATATSVIANRGSWSEPRLLKDVIGDRATDDVLPSSTQKSIELKNQDDWEFVVETMAAVMHGPKGTARGAAKDAPYRMAGKTGTAQVFSLAEDEEYEEEEVLERLRDHALFVGFAPVDDPQIAVAVIVENGGSGSGTAAPVARALFDAWLLGFPKEGEALIVGEPEEGAH